MRLGIPKLFLVAFTVLLVFSVAGRIGFVYGALPSCTTLPPTDVTATSATLRGSVNPNGKSTGIEFFGSHEIFGPVGNSPPQNIGSGVVAVPVSYAATGLAPSTSYEYFVGAANADGTCYGTSVSFSTLPAAVSTDWAVVSVSVNPSSPHVGDPVVFSMRFVALSSSTAFPQSVSVGFAVDGAIYATGSFSYPGPIGLEATVTSQTLWTATLGTHTLTGGVATVPAGNDPNPSNNLMSVQFTVAPQQTQTQQQFDFSISASPTQQSVVPGGSTSYTVTVNLLAGTTQSVTLTLSGEPTGVSGSFNPTSGTPPFTSTLSITAASSVYPGSVTITVTGSSGGVSHTATLTLTVSQPPDFRIDVSPPSQTVLQGQTTSYSINVVGLNGFNSQVSLLVSGLPSGANGVFSAPSGTPNFASTLTVTLPTGVATGAFTLTITGSGGGVTRTGNVVLVVNPTQTQPQTVTVQTAYPSAVGFMETLQQNSLIIIGALLALVILSVVFIMRGRGRGTVPQQISASRTFCGKCGAENPASNEFCSKCGRKL